MILLQPVTSSSDHVLDVQAYQELGWCGFAALVPPKLSNNQNVALIFASALFANWPFPTIVYWLPIWFQAILGATPTSSGVEYLPTVISDVLTSVIRSVVVMKLGGWNIFLLFGIAMMSVGSELLTTLYPRNPDGNWIGY